MRVLRILFIGIAVSVFLVGQAYSAPKGNNGKGNNANNANNGNANNGGAQVAKTNKGNNKAVAGNRGKSALHKQQARRSSEADRRREERSRATDQNSFLNNDNGRRNGKEMHDEQVNRGLSLLSALDRARWSQNSHDTRGQGNMGKVDMQDPLGHDKDSGRKELYGNNGRPIRISEEDAEQTTINLEEMISFEWQTENEMVAIYQEWIDYYNSLINSNSEYAWLSYYVSMYEDRVTYYESLSYQRVFLRGDATIDYTLNFDIPVGMDDTTLLISTSLVVSEPFTTYVRTYNEETGIWEYTAVHYEAGQVIAVVEEEAVVSPYSSDYVFSYDPPGDLLEGNEWNSDGGYFDVVITVTDMDAENSYTQTFDQSLYLYRDPYGKVEDATTGEAVVGAKITVFTENGSIVALDKASNPTANNPQMTDATGRFGFNLRTDRKYYMVASAPGYEDYQSEVFTEQWHVIREDIKMVPAQEQVALNME